MNIPKLLWNSKEALNKVRNGEPVVLLECPLCHPSFTNWTLENLMYLIQDNFPCDVFVSNSKRFTYWDNCKNVNGYDFEQPTTKRTMSMRSFIAHVQLLVETKQEGNIESGNSAVENYMYLQQGLVAEMGPAILEEYTKFSLSTAVFLKQLGGWNEMTNNLLLCGNEGYISSLHFDEQENLFAQLSGRKRVRLFSPHNWHRLYLFPNGHPCDRHAQVVLPSVPGSTVLENPADVAKFPEFATINGEEHFTDLEPGEILYIPQFWFHQMEGLSNGNVSLSWWFKHNTPTDKMDLLNINPTQISLIAVRRNLEKMLTEMAGVGINAHYFFLSIASGLTPLPAWNVAPSSSAGPTPSDFRSPP